MGAATQLPCLPTQRFYACAKSVFLCAPAHLTYAAVLCTLWRQVEVVEELLAYITLADFSMREDLVLKTAVLAERCVGERWGEQGRCAA